MERGEVRGRSHAGRGAWSRDGAGTRARGRRDTWAPGHVGAGTRGRRDMWALGHVGTGARSALLPRVAQTGSARSLWRSPPSHFPRQSFLEPSIAGANGPELSTGPQSLACHAA